MKKKVIAYVRSFRDEVEQSNSIIKQEETIHNYCQQENLELCAIFRDIASGNNFKRPGWLEMKDYLSKHKNSIVFLVTSDPDRIARNLPESLSEMEVFRKEFNVEFRFCKEGKSVEISDFLMPEQSHSAKIKEGLKIRAMRRNNQSNKGIS